jgi:predicted XRE-type DNA-binding protein
MKEPHFESVWDAIEASPAAAANMKARAGLMIALRETIEAWDVRQAAAAKRLGVTQPRLSDLLRGRIAKFSLDALMTLAARAGLGVRIEIMPRPHAATRPAMRDAAVGKNAFKSAGAWKKQLRSIR